MHGKTQWSVAIVNYSIISLFSTPKGWSFDVGTTMVCVRPGVQLRVSLSLSSLQSATRTCPSFKASITAVILATLATKAKFPSHVGGVDVHLHVQQNPYRVGVIPHGGDMEGREPRSLSQQPGHRQKVKTDGMARNIKRYMQHVGEAGRGTEVWVAATNADDVWLPSMRKQRKVDISQTSIACNLRCRLRVTNQKQGLLLTAINQNEVS